jgi:demethylmenaquinone methyltransferase / 2-methoxy-6-polyprenyl-1,4-benzoquinol methylase
MTPGKGTTPGGARDEREAAEWVRQMFGRVAGRYDFLNHLLSFQIDRHWRAATVRTVGPILKRPDARVLDLCCGTGDLALAMESARSGLVFGADFTHRMLVAARRKAERRQAVADWIEADALTLPFADRTFDLVTLAFGFRNLANYEAGLAELRRVLRPGGMLAILEFSTPPNALMRGLYSFYSTRILPLAGGVVAGDLAAYRYLPESVSKFPRAELLAALMEGAGFTRVKFRRMTMGIVALHTGLGG